MDPGLVSSLSGALAQSRRVDTIANNLANAETPGYKADDLIFEEAMLDAGRADTRSDVPETPFKDSEVASKVGQERRVVLYGAEFTDLRAGAFRETSNPLDVAIEGNGFLEVLTPNGIRLTRAGNLALDSQSRLVTKDGNLVLGQGAPGQDPQQRAITLGVGQPNIDVEGNVYASNDRGAALLGKLSMVQVENPVALTKTGNNLFEATPEAFVRPVGDPMRSPASVTEATNTGLANSAAPATPSGVANNGAAGAAGALDSLNLTAPGQGGPAGAIARANPAGSTAIKPKLHQGMLEGSNVNAVRAMTELIEAHRMFDQNTKLMQTVGDMNSRVSEVGKF